MENKISIGTGLVYKFYEDQNDRVNIIANGKYGNQGIELCIADASYLLKYQPTPEVVEYLKSLDYVTIHAPRINIDYSDSENSHKVLAKIQDLYSQIGAKNVTLHNHENADLSIFQKYNFQTSIENDDRKRPDSNTPDKIADILKNNPDFKFTFDFAHALTVGNSTVKDFIDQFKDKISQVHMSNLTRYIKDHNFLFRDGTTQTYELLKYVKDNLKVALVLECVASNPEEIALISQEIEFLRKF